MHALRSDRFYWHSSCIHKKKKKTYVTVPMTFLLHTEFTKKKKTYPVKNDRVKRAFFLLGSTIIRSFKVQPHVFDKRRRARNYLYTLYYTFRLIINGTARAFRSRRLVRQFWGDIVVVRHTGTYRVIRKRRSVNPEYPPYVNKLNIRLENGLVCARTDFLKTVPAIHTPECGVRYVTVKIYSRGGGVPVVWDY